LVKRPISTHGEVTPMARFLVTYYAGDMPHDRRAVTQVRLAFSQWAEKTGPALADLGSPIRSVTTISATGVHNGPAAGPFMGWSVIEAGSREAAAGILQDHPFINHGGMLQLSEPV
jgi:hypothetical protein